MKKYTVYALTSSNQLFFKLLTFAHLFDFSVTDITPATILVKKLVAVLESAEKLPVYTYDCPGSGLQVCILLFFSIMYCHIR